MTEILRGLEGLRELIDIANKDKKNIIATTSTTTF